VDESRWYASALVAIVVHGCSSIWILRNYRRFWGRRWAARLTAFLYANVGLGMVAIVLRLDTRSEEWRFATVLRNLILAYGIGMLVGGAVFIAKQQNRAEE